MKIHHQVIYLVKRPFVDMIIITYSIGFGCVISFGSCLTEIMHAFNYEQVFFCFLIQVYGPITAGIVIISGMIGSVIYSITLLKKPNQIKYLFFIIGGG